MTFPTNPIYKFIKDPVKDQITGVIKYNDNFLLSIPINEANTDYQEYLEWAKTNTAEEAD